MEVSGQFHAPAALALVLIESNAGLAPEPVRRFGAERIWCLCKESNSYSTAIAHIPGTVSAEIQRIRVESNRESLILYAGRYVIV